MKKFSRILSILSLSLSALLLNSSCKKTQLLEAESKLEAQSLTSTVVNYVKSQKNAETPIKNANIDLLLSSLELEQVYTEKKSKTENFIIVPLKSSFKIAYNAEKKPVNALLLVQDETGKITRGNILQYVPEMPNSNKSLPKGGLYKMHNSRRLDEDGKFSFLNFWNAPLCEFEYNEGKLSQSRVWKKKDNNTQNSSLTEEYCIQWTLITTIYHSDGTYEVFVEDLGITCSPCPPNELCDEIPGGGGGGEPVPQEMNRIIKDVDWVVAANNSGLWTIVSFERLKGIKVESNYTQNYFESITHITSVANNVGGNYVGWTQISCNASLFGSTNSNAQSTVKGQVKYLFDGSTALITGYNHWNAMLEF